MKTVEIKITANMDGINPTAKPVIKNPGMMNQNVQDQKHGL